MTKRDSQSRFEYEFNGIDMKHALGFSSFLANGNQLVDYDVKIFWLLKYEGSNTKCWED